ncbi:MAG: ferrous iron transporter B [Armatimonadota bacterium]|nr:ferrous iron transporter B [Armatimonadota bacterium]
MSANISPLDRIATYPPPIEEAVRAIEDLLSDGYTLSRRAIALLLLQHDEEIEGTVRRREGEERFALIAEHIHRAQAHYREPLGMVILAHRQRQAQAIAQEVVRHPLKTGSGIAEWVGRVCMQPLTGIPILLLVLYYGLYQFVGVFGGGTLVDWLENGLFGTYINPFVTLWVKRLIPFTPVQELFVGEYGIFTLGVTYAVALILPIVGTFFLMFSILEDSGYFPRLAMLIDRLFKKIGLNGRAVIPIVLGFGCDTMATMVTRILETPRERLIATFLLALAIPCSAQLGVIMALLASHPGALLIWALTLISVFLLIGWLTAKVLPGTPATFHIEIPPMRLPILSNVLTKTYARMHWYFREVFPLFILASVVIWLGQITGLFDLALHALTPVVRLMGLPDATASAFLFGFFRRDYGAAGLYHLQENGVLNGQQLLVTAVTLTLFLPCIAQFLMMKKERGLKTALTISAIIFPFAIAVGTVMSLILRLSGVEL